MEVETNERVRTHFKDVMDGCYYDWVDPYGCIPFTSTRVITNSGVKRLMALFDASFNGETIAGGGISCGTNTPIIVKLTGTLLVHAHEYFRKTGLSESAVKLKLKEREVWYGIVDGEHSHSAIIRLIENSARWTGYKWFVTVVKSGHNIDRYRQVARMQNERQSKNCFVEYTFFDMVCNMRTEYEKLCKTKRRVTGQDVVNVYCGYSGVSKKVSTLVQTANTVMRLPADVIKVIGEISNEEHPDLALSNKKINRYGATTVDEIMKKEDCRVFRSFLHITSLKSSTAFMNAKHKDGPAAQVYTMYRIKDIYLSRGLTKAIQPEEVARQYELSLYSIEEEKKFLDFLSPEEWPQEMKTLRFNLLKTIKLVDEVVLNHGNKEILPSLLKSYKRHFPVRYTQKEQKLKPVNTETQTTSDSDVPDSKLNGHTDDSTKTGKIPYTEPVNSENASTKSSENTGNDKDKSNNSSVDKIEFLRGKGVDCYNMAWQDFLTEVWGESSKPVDAIITDPPSSPSLSYISNNNNKNKSNGRDELTSADIIDITRKAKRMIKSGGYFIVMIEFEMFKEWYLAFKANGYNVMKKFLTFSYDQQSIPCRQSDHVDFPSGMEEYCVIARLPGPHPAGFNPNFQSNYNLIKCNWTKRASIVTNVELPKNRLCYPNSRKPYRMSEKPIALLAEVVDLFVPAYGTVLDIFGGTLTLPIAGIKTSRRCVAIEKDMSCFEAAIDRLFQICSPEFKFVLNKESSISLNKIDGGTISESLCTNKSAKSSAQKSNSDECSANKKTPHFLTTSYEETSRDHGDMTDSMEITIIMCL